MSADRVREWNHILDRFEADIAVAVSGGEPAPWDPPADAGPLPAELEDRALRVLDAHRESVTILGKARNDAQAHLDALGAIRDTRNSARPLFLDVQG